MRRHLRFQCAPSPSCIAHEDPAMFGDLGYSAAEGRKKQHMFQSKRSQGMLARELVFALVVVATSSGMNAAKPLRASTPLFAPHGSHANLVAPACAGATVTTTNFTNTTVMPIPDTPGPAINSTIVVSGVGTKLWDLDLTTFITHTYCADLDITLTSPAGTLIKVTTDNGGSNDDVFNGTTFDDSAVIPVTDKAYVDHVLATPLVPEGHFARLRGEDPNGTWTLTIKDDRASNVGVLNYWWFDITTIDALPFGPTVHGASTTALAIPDAPNPALVSTLVVSGASSPITDVDLTLAITHTNNSDLDVHLTSPSGTVVSITTGNGGSNDDVFNGTKFDDSAVETASDHLYANLTVVTPLVPEGALARFIGEDPNGTWTLTIQDELPTNTGTLHSWSLDIATCGGSGGPGTAYCFGDHLDPNVTTACPCNNFGTVGRGCANSVDAGGALLVGSGNTSPDTIVLSASGMPATVTSIFLAGNSSIASGSVFGDGVRCAGGMLIRLGQMTNIGGSSIYPSGAQPPISVKANTPPGSGLTGFYQTYYRNAAASFCPPATFNISNGWQITW